MRKWESDVDIIWVDCDDRGPDEYKDAQIVKTPILSYTEALNVAIEHSDEPWILSIDTDIICLSGFVHIFDNFLQEDTLYGNKYVGSRPYLNHPDGGWLDGWIIAVSKKVLNDIGTFDENIIASGFEDADLCFRAREAGYNIRRLDFPFQHLAAGQKRDISEKYDEKRDHNIEYVAKKHGLK